MMIFFRHKIVVSSSPPPEELLASFAGSCKLWQCLVITLSIFYNFINSMDHLCVATSLMDIENFTCKDEGRNGTLCHYGNGSKCETFIFYKHHNVTTFTEKFLLVCERKEYAFWVHNFYRLGLMLGSFFSGGCADRFGLKFTGMVFTALHCLTGLLAVSMSSVKILIFFVFVHGVFSTATTLIAWVAVCDVVGNNWRTFALAIIIIPRGLSAVAFGPYINIFTDYEGVVGSISVSPLVLMIFLLYFKDSPNYMSLISSNFAKAEGNLRRIAEINGCPISPEIKIRPVQLTMDHHVPHRSSFFQIWKPLRTRRAYLALICLFFVVGYCKSTLMSYTFHDNFMKDLSIYGYCSTGGIVIGIILMQWVPHKTIIGICEFLKGICIGGSFVYEHYQHDTSSLTFLVLKMCASVFLWTSFTALVNITPRMFPTELRSICCGFCVSLFQLGFILENIIRYYTNNVVYVTGLLLLLSPIVETFACFFLWDVHCRELPDFLIDAQKFERFYKPTRFYGIYDSASVHEIEIIETDLSTDRDSQSSHSNARSAGKSSKTSKESKNKSH